MRKLILLFFIFSISSGLQAQNIVNTAQAESFKFLLQKTHNDTTRLNILIALTRFYLEVNYDSSMLYGEQVYQLSTIDKSPQMQARVLDLMGGVLWRRGNTGTALQLYFKALQIAETLKDTALLSTVYLDIGNAYSSQQDSRKSIDYYLQSLKLVPSLGTSIGSDFTKVRALKNLGEQYLQLNELDSALYYEQQSYNLQMNLPEDRKKYLSHASQLLGTIHEKLGNINKALLLYNQGIKDGFAYNNLNAVSSSYLASASLFKRNKKLDSAQVYGREAFAVAQKVNNLFLTGEASRFLHMLYKESNQLDSAYKYQSIVLAVNDSLLSNEKIRQVQNISFNEQLRRQEIAQQQLAFRNQIKLYSLLAIVVLFLAIAVFLYRNNQQKHKANLLLQKQKLETEAQKAKAEQALAELKATQAQLIQREKMASLGELTAGIAHEIQNPLNFINNFSEVSKELVEEIKHEIDNGHTVEAKDLANNTIANLDKVVHHGKRADSIVKGMLQHSRAGIGEKQFININALADEYLRLSYQAIRAKDNKFNVQLQTHFDASVETINAVPQDIGRVLLNLFNNAFYAMSEKKKQLNGIYEPQLIVISKKVDNTVELHVKDNGIGIPKKIVDKIFQPFFTTKPTGEGTGLGLSLSYDIITKGHGGELKVNTREGEYTEFIVQLPTS